MTLHMVIMAFVTANAVDYTLVLLGNHGSYLIDIVAVDNWSFCVEILETPRLLQ